MDKLKIIQTIANKTKLTLLAVRYTSKKPDWKPELDTVCKEVSVSEINPVMLRALFPAEKILLKSRISVRETGEKIPAYITKFERQENKYLYLKNANADKLGSATIAPYQGGFCRSIVGGDYIYNSLELVSLESANKGNKASPFRGIGTELLKAAVKESKTSGFNGRLHLMAQDAHPPTPFYYKCGLRFVDEKKNKLMEEFLNALKSENKALDDSIKKGLMYLPDENIEKLLAL